ncbi:unnamed protein product [Discosporangium mesarthrocarpum]
MNIVIPVGTVPCEVGITTLIHVFRVIFFGQRKEARQEASATNAKAEESPATTSTDAKPAKKTSSGAEASTDAKPAKKTSSGAEASTDAKPAKKTSSGAEASKSSSPASNVKEAETILVTNMTAPSQTSTALRVADPTTIVVVTGATGRVGQLAVRRILELFPSVLVRAVGPDSSKVLKALSTEFGTYSNRLKVMGANLRNKRDVDKVVEGASAVVWCATGFAADSDPLRRLAGVLRMALNPKNVEEIMGVRLVSAALSQAKPIREGVAMSAAGPAINSVDTVEDAAEETTQEKMEEGLGPLAPGAPRFVLLSSAAVTRPTWSAEEKLKYSEAADIPIVKLNPSNILGIKAEGEDELRKSGLPYAVVRPCGLNDDHPTGRPFFSCGDMASGRISRVDVADVLARCLKTPEVTGKTFEVLTIPFLDKVSQKKEREPGQERAVPCTCRHQTCFTGLWTSVLPILLLYSTMVCTKSKCGSSRAFSCSYLTVELLLKACPRR